MPITNDMPNCRYDRRIECPYGWSHYESCGPCDQFNHESFKLHQEHAAEAKLEELLLAKRGSDGRIHSSPEI